MIRLFLVALGRESFFDFTETNSSSMKRPTINASQHRHKRPRTLLSNILLLLLYLGGGFPLYCASFRNSVLISLPSSRNCRGKDIQRGRCCEFGAESSTSTRDSPLHSMQSSTNFRCREDQIPQSSSLFPTNRPVLAIITETDACDTEEKMERTYNAVRDAVSTGKVDLVSVRLSLPSHKNDDGVENEDYNQILERACALTKKLVELSSEQQQIQSRSSKNEERKENVGIVSEKSPSCDSFVVVCSSDLVSVAVRARANGVHVKEHHLDQLPEIVRRFDYPVVIGTSTHSIESAVKSYFDKGPDACVENDVDESTNETKVTVPKPVYYFVGTCYLTASHPEKTEQGQLEGPELPGKIKQVLLNKSKSKQQQQLQMPINDNIEISSTTKTSQQLQLPRIFAIGGIDETNCHEPVSLGADGVAVIRAVLQANDPIEKVEEMQTNMMRASCAGDE